MEFLGFRVSFPITGRFHQDFPKFIIPESKESYTSEGVEKYGNDSTYFNNSLRRGFLTDEISLTIKDIISTIDLGGNVYSSVTLFRGTKGFNTKLEIGDCFTDGGFVSKTNDYNVAVKFTYKQSCCVWIVNYTRETKHLQIHRGESEFLTYPGERFRLLDIGEDLDNKRTIYYFEFVDRIVQSLEPNVVPNLKLLSELKATGKPVIGVANGFIYVWTNKTIGYCQELFDENYLNYNFPIVYTMNFPTGVVEYTYKTQEGLLITKDNGLVWESEWEIPIEDNEFLANLESVVSYRVDGIETMLPLAFKTSM